MYVYAARPFTVGTGSPEELLAERSEAAIVRAGLADCRASLARAGERFENVRLEERQELAFLLHDRVTRDVTAIALHLAAISRLSLGDPTLVHRIADTREIAAQAQAELRVILRELSQGAATHVPAEELFRRRVQELRLRHGVPISVHAACDSALDARAARAVARICREAVLNAIKHARCSKIAVRLTACEDRFVLLVADNGCGEVTLHAPQSATLGLSSMRQRARRIGGALRIRSPLGRGTAVRLRLRMR